MRRRHHRAFPGIATMRHWPASPRKASRIEIIPMIDVMMFLLVFFVLVSINVIPVTGLKTTLPESSQAADHRNRRNAIVAIAKSGELELDGLPVALAQLPGRLRAMRTADNRVFVTVRGDQATELQRLIDVMDVLKGAGFDAFTIASRKKA